MMNSGNIVNSFLVDRTCAYWGLPWCAPGKQPTVQKDNSFEKSDLTDIFVKVDKIFKVYGKFHM